MKKQSKSRPRTRKASRCKLKNWSQYNQALKQRGSLEVWIPEDVAHSWYHEGPAQRGRPLMYSEACIQLACVLKELYRLPYRQLEGYMNSLVTFMAWNVKVPSYTQINRRKGTLSVELDGCSKRGEKFYVVIDSSGLKVYGEGEWKVRNHGWSKHRTWRKIHLAIDESSGVIESVLLTTNAVSDDDAAGPLLDGVKCEMKKVAGDGAYDKHKVYNYLSQRGIKPIIPPRKNARISKHGNSRGKPLARDVNIRGVRKLGRKQWKKKSNYHRRNIAETTMFRLKNTFGEKLSSRKMKQQEVEVRLKCQILNKMNRLGVPQTIPLAKVA